MIQGRQRLELLKSYLLGAASADERETVEDFYFADGRAAARLLLAEDDLIDDYVRGALTPAERTLFEKNFLCTAERRRRVEFTRDLAESLSLAEADAPHARPTAPRDKAARWSRMARPLLARAPGGQSLGGLLEWLDPSRERAAEKYVDLHRKLTRMFSSRGCDSAEELADETFRRVSLKAPKLRGMGLENPSKYFYMVARLVLHEFQRARAVEARLPEDPAADPGPFDRTERAQQCLEECLQQLGDGEREMVLQYYSAEGREKLSTRKEMAHGLGLSLKGLQLRMFHLKRRLAECVTSCLERAEEEH